VDVRIIEVPYETRLIETITVSRARKHACINDRTLRGRRLRVDSWWVRRDSPKRIHPGSRAGPACSFIRSIMLTLRPTSSFSADWLRSRQRVDVARDFKISSTRTARLVQAASGIPAEAHLASKCKRIKNKFYTWFFQSARLLVKSVADARLPCRILVHTRIFLQEELTT